MSLKVLANDGIHPMAKKKLEENGLFVQTEKIEQTDLSKQLNEFDAIIIRSATKIRKDLIDALTKPMVMIRAGVGMDNIDVEYARSKGHTVSNTPGGSTRSVAELAMGHLLSCARFLPESNRAMVREGNTGFKQLKKAYSKGKELEGMCLGVIGFGRIGQETARIALGLGMRVVAVDPYISDATIRIEIQGADREVTVSIQTIEMDELLAQADAISLHLPSLEGKAVLGPDEFTKMKKGTILVNCARGGVVDEKAMMDALEKGILFAVGLDVFENEPTPDINILHHPSIGLSPHIGASTDQAQEKIGLEAAQIILDHFNI